MVDLGIDNMADPVVIGSGGSGRVYAATDVALNRRVAIKILDKVDAESQRRFERECRIIGTLSNHPNVVTVHSAGSTANDEPYLVMELLTGGSLGYHLAETGPIDWREVVGYMIKVADALQAAHEVGILHLDIKPDNILLHGGEPHVVDFGIARLATVDTTDSMALKASWYHTAPETIDDARDERSDIYSIGSTMHTLIAGRPPFWDPDDRALVSVMRRVVDDPPPPVGHGPPALDAILGRILAKNPEDRPQTARQLASELRELLEPPEPPIEPEPTGWRSLRSLVVTAAVVVGAALVGALVGGVVSLGSIREVVAPSAPTVGSLDQPYPAGQPVSLFYDGDADGPDYEWSVRVLGPAEPPPGADGRRSVQVRLTYRRGPAPIASPSDIRLAAASEGGTPVPAEPCEPAALIPAGVEVGGDVVLGLCWSDGPDPQVVQVEVVGTNGTVYLAIG